ncbi:uncharacterized protein [Musca autumnalis]|uniref:uncharacterized protein n=1 Tax=Musca autumnalis TaxID=221902 RepID=UPI003CEE2383
MIRKKQICAVLIFGVMVLNINGFKMNMTQYYKMPPLNDLDDYDRCLQEFNDESLYCFVRADIIAQPNVEAWQVIRNVSQCVKHHFNHSHLYFGICLEWCQSQIDALPNDDVRDLYKGILKNNKVVNTYLNLFKSEENNRQLYNELMNKCVNLRLKKFNLTAESVIEYCDSYKSNNNERALSSDRWNITFYVVVCVLILLITCSSFYDLYLKHKSTEQFPTDVDHYKKSPAGIVQKLGVGFSLARNWYRLRQEPNGKIGRDLRSMDCIKFFAMFLVVFAHTNWIAFESALNDPQDEEEVLHTAAGSVLENKGFDISFGHLLTILYGFIVLLSGVYFPNPGGPMYRHLVERETLACRKNWWINILYLNNHINIDERCVLQGWYLASDTHSFILSLIILILAHRFSNLRKWIYAATVAIFTVIPGVVQRWSV